MFVGVVVDFLDLDIFILRWIFLVVVCYFRFEFRRKVRFREKDLGIVFIEVIVWVEEVLLFF